MQSLVYDGSFEGFLCAVFDVYEYKYTDATIYPAIRTIENIFGTTHIVHTNIGNSDRLWTGLKRKLTVEAQQHLYRTFLSELPGIEDHLLHYIQYVFSSPVFMEQDYSHIAVITITQTAKKVWREKHRMEAFVRFQKTADDLYYAIIEPDYNVLPLIVVHFKKRYADQRWLIYDAKRKMGIHYDLKEVSEVRLQFTAESAKGTDVTAVYGEGEEMYQQLWQQYFKSVNIAARKNTKLHIQHMPKRYWKYLTEKKI
ncbi:MAG: TIGR03915 family putative DNA repair protein [Chitinophagaceae bacterium]